MFTPWHNSFQRILWWTQTKPNRILSPPKSNVFVGVMHFTKKSKHFTGVLNELHIIFETL